MDTETRAEIEKLHGRITTLGTRVTVLETTMPHINTSLTRIERSVDRLNGHVVKAIWAVIVMFIGVVFKFTIDGGFSLPIAG